MNTAIIVAAGSGTRFGGDTPKQFVRICGKPLLVHTLEKFQNCEAIDEIILVLAKHQISNFRSQITDFDLDKLKKIVSGGAARAESVFNGLKVIDEENAEIVAVHDGARPLVSEEEISNALKKANETGAACLVGKVNDTIKEVSDGKIVGTINREKLRRALTPQCFRYEVLMRAFEENEIDEIATDESFLVEKLGIEVLVVEGSPQNIKVTSPEDLIFVENYFKKNE